MKKTIFLLVVIIAILGFFCLWTISEKQNLSKKQVPTESSEMAVTPSTIDTSKLQNTVVSAVTGTSQSKTVASAVASGVAVPAARLQPSLTVMSTPTPQLTRVAVEFPKPQIAQAGDYSTITMSGCQTIMTKGQPMLPFYVIDLAVAPERNHRVILENAVWEEIVCAPPAPSAGPQLRNKAPEEAVPDAAIYQGGGVFPQMCVAEREYSLRGVHGIQVALSPVQYDFSRGVLRYCTRGELRLVTEEAVATDYSMVSSEWNFRQLQTRNILNAKLLQGQQEPCGMGSILMIVPDDWGPAVKNFVDWKQKIGYDVTVSLYPSETGEGPFCVADVISEAYQHGGTHVILCGRANDVPPYVYNPSISTSPGVVLAASDIPYVLLDGEDLKMDMFISRVPVGSIADLTATLDKLVRYEMVTYDENTVDYWREKAVTIASDEKSTHKGMTYYDYQLMHDETSKLLEHETMMEINELSEEYGPISSRTVTNALNGGCSLVNYLGHGQLTMWTSSLFSGNNAANLVNGEELPFVASYACMTADFAAVRPCLGESFLSATSGACGFLGATNDTYLWPPVLIMRQIDDELVALDTAERLTSHGALMISGLNWCVDHCAEYFTGVSGLDSFMDVSAKQFHLLGDCSMAARFRRLQPMNLAYDYDGLTEGLTVCVRRAWSSTPFVGASVCLEMGDGTRQAFRTDEHGEVSFAGVSLGRLAKATLCVYDPLHGLQEVALRLEADTDGDNHVSSAEVLKYLSETAYDDSKQGQRQLAIAAWKLDDGTVAQPVTRGLETVTCQTAVTEKSEVEPEWFSTDDRPVRGGNREKVMQGLRGAEDTFQYESHDALQEHLESLWQEHWDCCRPVFIGESVEKRAIMGVRIGAVDKASPLELLIAGGIHGNERMTVAMTMKMIEWLLMEGLKQEALKAYFENTVLYVIPCMNPDGAEAVTRGNCHEVDLNRAFPDGVDIANLGMYRDGSALYLENREPEVASFMRWCCSRRLSAALLIHSGSYCIAYPYGNNQRHAAVETPTPDDEQFRRYAQAYANGGEEMMDVYNAAAWYPVTGECPDWLYRCLGVKALTVELSTSKESTNATFMEAVFDNHLPRVQAWLECVLKEETAPTVELPPLEVVMSSQRYVPERSEWLMLKRHEVAQLTNPYIVRLTLPEGWLYGDIADNASLSAWREEADGAIALLYGEGVPVGDSLTIPVTTTDSPEADHVVVADIQTADGTAELWRWNWLTAEPCTYQETTANYDRLYGMPVYPRQSQGGFGQKIYVWDGAHFVLETPVKPSGFAAYSKQRMSCPAWFSGDIRLQQGWNLVGVPWTMPSTVLGNVVFGNAERTWARQTWLSRGQGYWVYCTASETIRFQ